MQQLRIFGLLFVSAGIALAQEQAPEALDDVFNTDAAVEPVAASTGSASFQYTVAHFPFGGGWNTQILLGNGSGKTASVKVAFFNQAGASVAVPLAGKGSQSSQSFGAASNRTLVISGDTTKRNSASAEEVWALVTSNQPLDSSSLSDLSTSPPAVSSAVGGQTLAPSKSFRFPVLVNGPVNFDTQLAIANPNTTTATITVKLLSSSGSVMGSFQESLLANNQALFKLTDKMHFGSSLFTGAVAVCSSEPVGLAAFGIEGVGTQAMYNTAVTTDPCP